MTTTKPRFAQAMRGLGARLLAAALCLTLLGASARAEYWQADASRALECRDDRAGCQLLQMVMMGGLAEMDASDTLSVRVFSAALPLLRAVTQEDLDHFADEFDVEERLIREFYYIALGNCLWADILLSPQQEQQAAEARRVLLLFLDPSSEPNGREQMAIIRSSISDEAILTLAVAVGLPVEFVEYLIYGELEDEAD